MFFEAYIPAEFHALMTVALCVFMVSAVMTDIKIHRIRNSLVLWVLMIGLVSQLAMDMNMGLLTWINGLLIGLVIFLPFYIGGGMGAGDVKLMAAVAAFLGPVGGVIACGSALIAGLPLAIFYMIKRLRSIYMHRLASEENVNSHMLFDTFFLLTHPGHANEPGDQTLYARERIPYAAAIFAGMTVGLWWTDKLEPFFRGLA